MANHVTTRVTIDCNETAQVVVEHWREAIEGMDNDDYKMVWKLFGLDAEEVTHQWLIENIGSKWCYSDDIYDNNFTLVSAWDWPDKFVAWMAEQVIGLDQDATITVTYEDEGANFVGYHVFTKLGDRGDSTDFDSLVEMVKKAVPEIVELEEGSDEYFDMLYDNIWDATYAWQEDGLSAA
jgi:hypothetical protein